jgi:hypothetical protein
MSNAVSAQGTDLYIASAPATGSSAVSPTSFVKVSEVVSFSRSGDRAEIDVSSLDSTAREFRLGLQDNGTLSGECMAVFDDAGQVKMTSALASPDEWDFRLDFPDGSQNFFRALVKKFDLAGGVDDVLRRTFELRLTGPISEVVA